MADKYNLQYAFDDVADISAGEVTKFLADRCKLIRPPNGDRETYADEITSLAGIRCEYRGTVFDCSIHGKNRGWIDLPTFNISIDERWILTTEDDSDTAAIERMNEFYTLLGYLYEQFVALDLEPLYVYGLDFTESDIARDPAHTNHVSREKLLNQAVPGIFWFQIFPPAIVQALGEDRVHSCPAYRLEELSDGAVLLAGNQGVLVDDYEEYRDSASEHLGIPLE